MKEDPAASVAAALASGGDARKSWETALARACEAAGSAAGVLWEKEADALRALAAANVPAAAFARLAPQPVAAGAPGAEKEALRAGRTLHVADLAKHPLGGTAAKSLAEEGLVSLLAVPLVDHGEAVGVLALYCTGPFDGRETAAAESLAPVFALALRAAALRADVAGRVRRLEHDVRARTADLDARAREMQEFLSGVGHDLRSPLVALSGLADAVEEDLADPEAARRSLARIRANVGTMEALVEDLLELARLGRAAPVATEVPLGPLVRRVADAYAPRFAALGGRVEARGEFPTVVGEAARLERAVGNLVDNALKYRAEGRPPVLRVVAVGDEVRFEDNGRGFPPAFAGHLFRPFQRHAPEAAPGTGLGLVLVKRIVEGAGGQISAESVDGKGATFALRFPRDAG